MFNIIVGAFFILGGLTGSLVLKGTGSSAAIACVGVVLCVWGFIQLSTQPKAKPVSRRVVRRAPPRRPIAPRTPSSPGTSASPFAPSKH